MTIKEFSNLEVPSMYKAIDTLLKPRGLELYALSSKDKSIDEFEADEVELDYESIKLCLINEDGDIQRETMSEAYVLYSASSHKQALIAYFKTLFPPF